MLSFFPLDVLDEIWDVIESVFEGFLTYFRPRQRLSCSPEILFERVDGRRRRTTEPLHPINSPGAFGSGELKCFSVDLLGSAA